MSYNLYFYCLQSYEKFFIPTKRLLVRDKCLIFLSDNIAVFIYIYTVSSAE